MMQSLDEKTWMPSVVDEVFTSINSTKGKTTAQLVEGDDVPYIAAAKTNNGCAGIYSSKPYPEWVSDGNAIVFVQLGDGAAGLAHYVPMPFIGMSGKTSCGYFQSLNKDNGIFIAQCLSANKAFFLTVILGLAIVSKKQNSCSLSLIQVSLIMSTWLSIRARSVIRCSLNIAPMSKHALRN